ncbi:hypothetical protein EXIGLDRAFT_643201 [Exidia glandulosa HHB12029]|uniref:Oxidase ustYa n=1 Tax=Exidia glandulosa HHB12029 TaxID=1314781 RepID=A0A165KJA9_EXIGL|nr:hypothetical protein EXIGLDRAFT_643201 [Exidia glandulosa HHB12029]
MKLLNPRDTFTFVIATTVLLFTVVWSALSLWRAFYAFHTGSDPSSYTYREYDFPPTILPLSQHPYNSRMIIDNTVHYAPGDEGRRDWASLFPSSLGFVRLGPDNRTFGISMFHQLHCLQSMQNLVFNEPTTEMGKWHASHCMNYLRQMLLCAADIRLEPFRPDPALGIDKVDGLDLTHTCRDWTRLRDIAEDNFAAWPEDIKAAWHF